MYKKYLNILTVSIVVIMCTVFFCVAYIVKNTLLKKEGNITAAVFFEPDNTSMVNEPESLSGKRGGLGNIYMEKQENGQDYYLRFISENEEYYYCSVKCDNGSVSNSKLMNYEACRYEVSKNDNSKIYKYVEKEDTSMWEQINDSILDSICVEFYNEDGNLVSVNYKIIYESYDGELCMMNN